jgi:hypothetical protein
MVAVTKQKRGNVMRHGSKSPGTSARFLTWVARGALLLCIALPGGVLAAEPAPGSNPLLRDVFTADPAPLVVGDTAYLYVGHDEAKGDEFFRMNDWRVYSSRDLKHWTSHGAIMKPTDFTGRWAKPGRHRRCSATGASTSTPP